jgi:phosphatidate cytidylyltransferase
MAVFMYVYYWTYVARPELAVGDVLSSAMRLSNTHQLELFGRLGNMLVGEGLLPSKWRWWRWCVLGGLCMLLV